MSSFSLLNQPSAIPKVAITIGVFPIMRNPQLIPLLRIVQVVFNLGLTKDRSASPKHRRPPETLLKRWIRDRVELTVCPILVVSHSEVTYPSSSHEVKMPRYLSGRAYFTTIDCAI